ncbi:olfactory receptor 1019-like [Malaclemys terrapin pileata]|uniref:olfactory receptor 1019-like n=1 Tax=Malaclemys terrapin pileata TaxID=2991368 RepID=UPI0023A7940D|nr:olfactory receptor 1019-like [Malaclemys terrapin pileata]
MGILEKKNCTVATQFILMGFTDGPKLQVIYFVLFLVIYVITLVGNLGMIILIRISSRLHTPMYFFLCNLSVVDICYSSVVTPKMLENFLAQSKAISYSGCLVQLYFFIIWLSTECLLLAVMAYDRYVAICKPLLYSAVMSHKLCVPLVASSYFTSFTSAMITACLISRLTYCGSNIINHFFCDTPPLLALSSSDSSIAENTISFLAGFTSVSSLLIILFSYLYILAAILRIHSAKDRHKAFNTCASHLTAVTMFYGTLIFTYLRTNTSYSLGQDQVASVFYTVVIPMLNPLIYSLRNKEVKDALRRSLGRGSVLKMNAFIKMTRKE